MSHLPDLSRQVWERGRIAPHTKDIVIIETKRLIWHEVAPEGAKALFGIHHYLTTGTNLPEELIHLVFLRVSQINGCAHCIDLHTRDLLKAMSADKVTLVPVWAEVPHLFPEQYRSALAWAEEVTLFSETHASDEAYAAGAAAFDPGIWSILRSASPR